MDEQQEQKRVEELITDSFDEWNQTGGRGLIREILKTAIFTYGNARYAEGVEASAKMCADLYDKPTQPEYTGHCEGWKDGLDIAESSIRSLLPGADKPATKQEEGK